MQKWEYKCVAIVGAGESTTRQLNALGNEGWELVAVASIVWHYFKRPVIDDKK